MARSTKRKVLYEALKLGQAKFTGKKGLNRSHILRLGKSVSTAKNGDLDADQDEYWPPDSPAARTISGRLVLSVPYPIVIIAVLMLILTILAAFKIGQIAGRKQVPEMEPPTPIANTVTADPANAEKTKKIDTDDTEKTPLILLKPVGDHIILIATCNKKRDLEPVKDHFAKYGIDSEIQKKDPFYTLVAKQRYQNPKRVGTDGYAALERIKQVGALYQAPKGYLSFAPLNFQDAYPVKIR